MVADERLGFERGREEQLRRSVADEIGGRPPAAGEQRPNRRQVEADERPGGTGQLDRPTARETQRLAEQRVRGEMKEVRGEGAGREIVGPESICRRPVRDEAAFAVRCEEDADPAGPLPGDAGRAEADAVALERGRQSPAFRIPPDRAHERRPDAETRQPSRRGCAGRRACFCRAQGPAGSLV